MKEVGELSQVEKIQLQKDEEVCKIIRNHDSANTYLDLAARSIYYIPEEFCMLSHIEHLYLEGNLLEELPEDFFEVLPQLTWLDLRDNKLVSLPSSIGSHINLKNLLLEKNQISELPLELGNVRTLTGLSLRGNPLVFPPPEIVEQGVQVILSYLLEAFNTSGEFTGREAGDDWQYDENDNYFQDDNEDGDEINFHSPWNGDNKIRYDMALHGPTPVPAMFHQPKSRNKYKEQIVWRDKQLNGSASGNVKVNQINLLNVEQQKKRSDVIDRKNWLAQVQQRKKSTMVLDEWRQEAKRLQSMLIPKSKPEISHPLPPYGVDGATAEVRPVTREEMKIHVDAVEEKVDKVEPKNGKPPKNATEKPVAIPEPSDVRKLSTINHAILGISSPLIRKKDTVELKESTESKRIEKERRQKNTVKVVVPTERERIDSQVQERIRLHTSQLRFRKQKNHLLPPGKELQRELLDQKMSRNPELEYRFRAFTGDSSSFTSSKKTPST